MRSIILAFLVLFYASCSEAGFFTSPFYNSGTQYSHGENKKSQEQSRPSSSKSSIKATKKDDSDIKIVHRHGPDCKYRHFWASEPKN